MGHQNAFVLPYRKNGEKKHVGPYRRWSWGKKNQLTKKVKENLHAKKQLKKSIEAGRPWVVS